VLTHPDHLPSLQALEARDERLLRRELGVVALKQEVAVVRMLADELERDLETDLTAGSVRKQLADELLELGCRVLAAAAAMAKSGEGTREVEERSGVRLRRM